MSDVSKLPTADLIVNEWLTNPPQLLFLVDETRRTLYGHGNEIVIFTCVAVDTHTAYSVLERGARIRRDLGVQESLKSGNLLRQEANPRYQPLLNLWADAIRLATDVRFLTTSGENQKKQSRLTKTRIKAVSVDRSRSAIIEGPELQAVIHLLLFAAHATGLRDSQVDAIVDRSDSNGLCNRKRRLPPGTMEVLGPDRFTRHLADGRSEPASQVRFRLIADSDQGPFRDLLMIPDLCGHLVTKALDVSQIIKRLSGEGYFFLPLTLTAVQRAFGNRDPGVVSTL